MHFTIYQQFLAHPFKTAYLRYHTIILKLTLPLEGFIIGCHGDTPWWGSFGFLEDLK